MLRSLSRKTIVAATGLVIGLGTVVGVSTASADTAPQASLIATYPVNGSTTIAATNSSMDLGPGSLTATLDVATSTFTADLALPAATGSFKEFGVVPVTATTEFIQDSPTTGKVVNGGMQSTSEITIKLDDLKVAGLDVPIGGSCESATPATVNLTSGTGFNVLLGGPVSGTYTIPQFSGCLLATPLINLTIPGSGNSISLTLGKPTVKVG
jgi:hypothetical protein